MKRSMREPERWSGRAGAVTGAAGHRASAEDELGALFRRLQEATAIEISGMPLIAAHPVRATSRHGTRLAWRLVLASAVVVATGGAVRAAQLIWRSIEARAQTHAVGGESVARSVAHRLRGEWVQAPLESPPASPEQPRSSPPPTAPAIALAEAHPASAATIGGETLAVRSRSRGESAAPPGETRWVAEAFHALRVDGDPAAALQALDQYARRFPAGALASEARVARVEALLALGRTGDALPLLLTVRNREAGLTRDIQITRAELLAERDRCAEAMPDFDDLLGTDLRDAVGERALYGRAACHLRAGRTVLARQDLARYLSTYPTGRFAGAARRAADDLGTRSPPSP